MLRTISLLLSPLLLSGSVLTYGPTDMAAFVAESQVLGGTALGTENFPNNAVSLPGLSIVNCSGPNCASPGLDTITGNTYHALDATTWGLYSWLQTRLTLPTDAVGIGFDFSNNSIFNRGNPVGFVLDWSDNTSTVYTFPGVPYNGFFGILSTSGQPVSMDFVTGFWNASAIYVPEGQYTDPSPEPMSIGLLGLGLVFFSIYKRRMLQSLYRNGCGR